MGKYRIKIRNKDIFFDIMIPEYMEKSENFDLVKHLENIIIQYKIPLDYTIIYEFNEDDTISCLGIDDGYEVEYNSKLEGK